MKYWHMMAAFLLVAVLLVVGYFTVLRWVASVAVHMKVSKPAPHIECVTATSVDGIALACNWNEALQPIPTVQVQK